IKPATSRVRERNEMGKRRSLVKFQSSDGNTVGAHVNLDDFSAATRGDAVLIPKW
ncbi:hypothetical protein SK128_027374, partial [Halocaridina rubra]